MGQNNVTAKRCRGRPQVRPDEETLHLLVEAAAEEFEASGYAAATMGNVAQRAGISTKTMYRLIPNKAELFKNVISDRINRFMLEIDPHALDAFDLTEALEHILIAFGSLTLHRETIAMVRLVIGECDRFPELAATFHEIAVVQSNVGIIRWLERQQQRGRLKIDEPAKAASALRGMMAMDLQRTAMLGLSHVPTPEEIKDRAQFCAKLFLDGCRA